jgi:hypothetical protein
MMMSPLFKEETSFTILHKSGYLDSVPKQDYSVLSLKRDTVTTETTEVLSSG